MEKSIAVIKRHLACGSVNIFGLAFSGKDTVGQRLAQDLGALCISSGEILRQAEVHDAGMAAEAAQGKLVDQDKFRSIVLPHFYRADLKGRALILSSVGRWSGEEKAVMENLEKSGHPLKAVLWLDIDMKELRRRWMAAKKLHDRGRRQDDADYELIKTRVQEFENKTLPVLDYYKKQGLMIRLDGSGERDAVYARVVRALEVKLADV